MAVGGNVLKYSIYSLNISNLKSKLILYLKCFSHRALQKNLCITQIFPVLSA